MGQNQSITEKLIPDTVDNLHVQVMKYAKVFSEIGSISYEEFQKCLLELNDLSRKCLDPSGKQLVFLVKKGTDNSLLWKATVQIGCVKVHPITRHIDSYKFLNLKQFLCVFKTFQTNLQSLVSSEEQKDRRESFSLENATGCNMTASLLMDQVYNLADLSSSTTSQCSTPEKFEECSICLDRSTEVILPCTHSFCSPCIEQWNVNNKTCPICCQELATTDDTWVMSEVPGMDEISEKICIEFMNLSKVAK